MTNKVKWTTEWPTEDGEYWFYGWRDHYEISDMRPPQIHCVRVLGIPGGVIYANGSEPMFRSHRAYGVWTKVDFPELPEIERPEIEESE